MKIRPLGAEIHADGRTDRDMKLIVAFRHFANAPKNTLVYVLLLSFSPLFHPSLFLMFTGNSWSFYLPPPDLGAFQPYMYKIVLFCEKPLIRCPFGTGSIYCAFCGFPLSFGANFGSSCMVFCITVAEFRPYSLHFTVRAYRLIHTVQLRQLTRRC
jgi:hypothetical protein